MRVGFDSDGVLDNFGEGVRLTLELVGQGHLWKSGPTKKPYWNFYEDWGWDYNKFKQLCDHGVDEGIIFSGHWREGAIEAVKRVKELGHRAIIITDRAYGSNPYNSQRNTQLAYEKAGIEYDELYFSKDKTCVWTDMFVEDKIPNYDALEAVGTDAYLINRPWNDDDIGDGRKRIPAVSTYAEIVALKTQFDKSRAL
jgi:hypothetical protein